MNIGDDRGCLHLIGDLDLLTLVAVVGNTHGDDLVGIGHAAHSVGVHHSAVNGEGQGVGTGALQLEGNAGADCIGCCLVQSLPVAPTGDGATGCAAAVSVGALVVVDTEGIGLAVIHCNPQGHAEADLAVAVLAVSLGQVVLGVYGNGAIFAGNIGPPGIIICRIVGIEDTMSLVCKIPAVCVQSSDTQGRHEVSGDIVNFLSGFEAVGIGLPIQLQGLTVDVQLLGIALSGGNGEGDGIADLVAFLVGGNSTIGHLGDVQLDICAGIRLGDFKGDLDLLTLVAVVTNIHRHYLVGIGHTVHGVGIHHSAVNGESQSITSGTLKLERNTRTTNCSNCGIVQLLPATPTGDGATGCAAAVGVGALVVVDTEGVGLTVIHGGTESDTEAHLAITILAVRNGQIVLGHHRNGRIIALDFHPPCIIICGIVNVEDAMRLVCSIPSACILGNRIDAGLEGTGNVVNFLRSNKAVAIGLPIQQERIAVDVQLLTVAFIGSNGQGNGITNLILVLLGGNRAIGQSSDVQLHIRGIGGSLELEGNFDLLTLVAIVLNANGNHLVVSSNAVHGIGFHDSTVDGEGQLVGGSALQLEIHTLTIEIGCIAAQVLPAAPTGCGATGAIAVISIGALIVDDTEGINLTVIHGHTQDDCEADLAVSVLAVRYAQIVLSLHGDGSVFTIDIHPPGIIVVRIIDIKNAVSLIVAVPSAGIRRSQIQAGLKAAGNIIDILVCDKAVGIGFPIQQQGIAVDVQLLAVAGVGSNGQGDGVAQLIDLLIRRDGAIGHVCNIDADQLAGIQQLKGDLYFLIQIAVHSDLDADTGIRDIAGIAGGNDLSQIQGGDLDIIDVNQCVATLGHNPEIDTLICDLSSLGIGQGVVVLPGLRNSRSGHDLHSVLAVIVGVIQSQAQSFTVGEGEVIDHGEVLGIGIGILDQSADIVAVHSGFEPAGIATVVTIHLQNALVLLQQFPRAILIFGKLARSKFGSNLISVLRSDKAVGAVPVGLDLLTIDLHLGVVIAGITG